MSRLIELITVPILNACVVALVPVILSVHRALSDVYGTFLSSHLPP